MLGLVGALLDKLGQLAAVEPHARRGLALNDVHLEAVPPDVVGLAVEVLARRLVLLGVLLVEDAQENRYN